MLATAASEVGRNAVVYGADAEGFVQRVRHVERRTRSGVRVIVRDRGPGIDDLDAAMVDGFSTGGSLGRGLGGSRRLVDEFEVVTSSTGTSVSLTTWV